MSLNKKQLAESILLLEDQPNKLSKAEAIITEAEKEISKIDITSIVEMEEQLQELNKKAQALRENLNSLKEENAGFFELKDFVHKLKNSEKPFTLAKNALVDKSTNDFAKDLYNSLLSKNATYQNIETFIERLFSAEVTAFGSKNVTDLHELSFDKSIDFAITFETNGAEHMLFYDNGILTIDGVQLGDQSPKFTIYNFYQKLVSKKVKELIG